MEQINIWTVIVESVYYGDDEIKVYNFSSESSANTFKNKMVQDFFDNDHLAQNSCVQFEESPNSFCAYLNGRYSDDHFSVSIEHTILDSEV